MDSSHLFRLVMIIPSMGRPAAAAAAAESALANAALSTTAVVIAVDGPHPDEQRAAYAAIARSGLGVLFDDQHRGMVGTLNRRAHEMVGGDAAMMVNHRCRVTTNPCGEFTHVGFMGDDHRVRTHGWDALLMEAAGPWGIAYGDDLLRGAELPTSVVMAADIVRTLGWMGPPTLGHMYIDDYWRDLGRAVDDLHYVPEVVIEHLHPAAGKAAMDESYQRSNHPDQYARDCAAYAEYRDHGGLGRDVFWVKAGRADLERLGVGGALDEGGGGEDDAAA
jgi:hypothetical protein